MANKKGFYIVDPDRKGAAPSKPKDAKDNESQKAYYTLKYMEIHAARRKKKGQSEDWSQWLIIINNNHYGYNLAPKAKKVTLVCILCCRRRVAISSMKW